MGKLPGERIHVFYFFHVADTWIEKRLTVVFGGNIPKDNCAPWVRFPGHHVLEPKLWNWISFRFWQRLFQHEYFGEVVGLRARPAEWIHTAWLLFSRKHEHTSFSRNGHKNLKTRMQVLRTRGTTDSFVKGFLQIFAFWIQVGLRLFFFLGFLFTCSEDSSHNITTTVSESPWSPSNLWETAIVSEGSQIAITIRLSFVWDDAGTTTATCTCWHESR